MTYNLIFILYGTTATTLQVKTKIKKKTVLEAMYFIFYWCVDVNIKLKMRQIYNNKEAILKTTRGKGVYTNGSSYSLHLGIVIVGLHIIQNGIHQFS
jgi:hypothetical protein